MRPAEVCGCVSSPSDSSSASSPRTVEGETPSPERSTTVFEPTGSPVAMYSSTTRRRMSRLRVLSSSICRAIVSRGKVAPVKPEAVARTELVLDAAAAAWTRSRAGLRARRSLARPARRRSDAYSPSGRSTSPPRSGFGSSTASTPPCAHRSCRSCSAGRTRSSRCSSWRISPRRTGHRRGPGTPSRPCSARSAKSRSTPPPDGLSRLADDPSWSWRDVAGDPEPFLGLGLCSAAWLDQALPAFLAASDPSLLDGDGLLHGDVRSDNLCIRDGQAVLVDWNWACCRQPGDGRRLLAAEPHARGRPGAGRDRTRLSGRSHARTDRRRLLRRRPPACRRLRVPPPSGPSSSPSSRWRCRGRSACSSCRSSSQQLGRDAAAEETAATA